MLPARPRYFRQPIESWRFVPSPAAAPGGSAVTWPATAANILPIDGCRRISPLGHCRHEAPGNNLGAPVRYGAACFWGHRDVHSRNASGRLAGAAQPLLIATTAANAGGFALREQSAYGQGSYLPVSRPAATCRHVLESGGDDAICRSAKLGDLLRASSPTRRTRRPPAHSRHPGGTDNTDLSSIRPVQLYVHAAQSATVGRDVVQRAVWPVDHFPDLWAGRDYAGNTTLKTYNAAPSIAFKINDWISVGAGMQIQYASADLSRGYVPVPRVGLLRWIVPTSGAPAGAMASPRADLDADADHRPSASAIARAQPEDQWHACRVRCAPLPGSTNGSVYTTIDLPDIVSSASASR